MSKSVTGLLVLPKSGRDFFIPLLACVSGCGAACYNSCVVRGSLGGLEQNVSCIVWVDNVAAEIIFL